MLKSDSILFPTALSELKLLLSVLFLIRLSNSSCLWICMHIRLKQETRNYIRFSFQGRILILLLPTNDWNYFFLSDFRVKFTQLFLLAPGVQICWNFCDFFFSYWNMAFFIFGFINSVRLFKKNIVNFLQYIANAKPLEFLWYLVPFLKHKQFNFQIFNSVPYNVLKNVDLKKVFALKVI